MSFVIEQGILLFSKLSKLFIPNILPIIEIVVTMNIKYIRINIYTYLYL